MESNSNGNQNHCSQIKCIMVHLVKIKAFIEMHKCKMVKVKINEMLIKKLKFKSKLILHHLMHIELTSFIIAEVVNGSQGGEVSAIFLYGGHKRS